jgi:hypothetical protein
MHDSLLMKKVAVLSLFGVLRWVRGPEETFCQRIVAWYRDFTEGSLVTCEVLMERP